MKFHRHNGENGEVHHAFRCPGCGNAHMIRTAGAHQPVWSFNGDVENPTVSPSILVNPGNDTRYPRCHSFVRDGKIQFLADCTHALAGQTVDIPDWDEPQTEHPQGGE